MDNRNQIIKKFTVPRWRLFLGTLIGLTIYPILMYVFYFTFSGLWEAISGTAVEPPVIGFMSSYGKAAQNGYWIFVWSAILCGLILSAWLPSKIGASLGKHLLGISYVNELGQKISLRQTLIKTMYNILLFLALALPGPIIGFSIGYGSEALSLGLLFLATCAVLYFAFKRDESGRTLPYRKSGVVPISRKDIQSFKSEITPV